MFTRAKAAILILLTAVAAGCAPHASPVPRTPPNVGESQPVAAGEGIVPQPEVGTAGLAAPVPDVLAHPAVGALTRLDFQAGDAVGTPGIYFLNSATGKGEGWTAPDAPAASANAFRTTYVSGDNRYAIVQTAQSSYVIDRAGGAVWQANQARPLLADEAGFLFAETRVEGDSTGARSLRTVETGRYFWTGSDFRPLQTFTLQAPAVSHLLSPDSTQLALLYSADDQYRVALVDLRSGLVEILPGPSLPDSRVATLHPDGDRFQVILAGGPPSRGIAHQVIRRFDWSGVVSADLAIPGNYVFFSPDGRWVAWEARPLGYLAPVTIVADAVSLQPRLQALGATTCFETVGTGGARWLADSSGLVVSTTAGYRLLTVGGDLQSRVAFSGLGWKDEPQPAPDRADRFALGRTTIADAPADRTGVQLEQLVTPASLDPWGRTSAELRFSLPPPARGGACTERPPMDPVVMVGDSLPVHPLTVRAGATCLQLWDSPWGAPVGCLTAGTRLALQQPSSGESVTWANGAWWVSVKGEQGETGWVSLDGGPLTWSAP